MQTTLSELGIVSSRVALLLRSAEIKPVFHGFVGGSPPPRCEDGWYRFRCVSWGVLAILIYRYYSATVQYLCAYGTVLVVLTVDGGKAVLGERNGGELGGNW